MSVRSWTLIRDGLAIGRLSLSSVDQPFFYCSFVPTEQFEPLADLFAADAAAMERGDEIAMQAMGERIEALGLVLVAEPDATEIRDPLIHIAGPEAWFRY